MRLGQKPVEIQERLPVYEPPLFGLRHVADRQIRNVLQERAGKANSKNGKGA